jgi:nicotinamidase-related amidase
MTVVPTYSQIPKNLGVNLTGLQRSWKDISEKEFTNLENQMIELSNEGLTQVRIPIDIPYHFDLKKEWYKGKFEERINQLIDLARRKDIKLVFSYFHHGLTQENYKWKSDEIAGNWLNLLQSTSGNLDHIYLDIVNEPAIYPNEWEESALHIITAIRLSYPDINIVCGSTNYSSIYELSRWAPLPFDNIIYAFHFYEPFIFTHQGTFWSGPQNTTVGIPFPYPTDDPGSMPVISDAALGTDGEVNHRDYEQTGTYQAIEDKINGVASWAKANNVTVWCTEYGVTENASSLSRKRYLDKVSSILELQGIQGFIWEYEGNFGVKKLYNTEIEVQSQD